MELKSFDPQTDDYFKDYECDELARTDKVIMSVILIGNDDLAYSCGNEIRFKSFRGNNFKTLKEHCENVRDLYLVEAGQPIMLSCSDDNTMKMWNFKTSQCLKTFFGHTNVIYKIIMFNKSKD